MMFAVVAMAGALGAVSRYLLSGWVQRSLRWDFPIGTLAVNALGSLTLGLVVGGGNLESHLVIGIIGFLGGFTTFSTWMVETVRMGTISARALSNLFLSLFAGVGCAAIGFTLTL